MRMPRIFSVWITETLLVLVCLLSVHASPVGRMEETETLNVRWDEERSASTCADPSLARPMFLAFAALPVAHILNFRWVLANADTTAGAPSAFWTLQGEVFRAWQTQQPFTVPLFVLINTDETDYIALTGTEAVTPPVVSGFGSLGVVAWVYANPQCGSIPVYSLANPAFTDHYYTVEISDRDNLVENGWTDEGIIAYVLPL